MRVRQPPALWWPDSSEAEDPKETDFPVNFLTGCCSQVGPSSSLGRLAGHPEFTPGWEEPETSRECVASTYV